NPLTHETVSVATDARAADAQLAVDAAARAFPEWSALGPSARRQHLTNAARVLRERGDEFTRRMSAETGATPGWGHFNVQLAALLLDEAAALTEPRHYPF
ncbi:MAG: hypothetical protein RL701_6179, partial [Pseudomonadota bacterium]